MMGIIIITAIRRAVGFGIHDCIIMFMERLSLWRPLQEPLLSRNPHQWLLRHHSLFM